jgi:hypothetical protein
MCEIIGAKFTDNSWDTSKEDVKNIMRGEFDEKTIKTFKCLRSLSKNRVKRTDTETISKYIKKYGAPESRVIAAFMS